MLSHSVLLFFIKCLILPTRTYTFLISLQLSILHSSWLQVCYIGRFAAPRKIRMPSKLKLREKGKGGVDALSDFLIATPMGDGF